MAGAGRGRLAPGCCRRIAGRIPGKPARCGKKRKSPTRLFGRSLGGCPTKKPMGGAPQIFPGTSARQRDELPVPQRHLGILNRRGRGQYDGDHHEYCGELSAAGVAPSDEPHRYARHRTRHHGPWGKPGNHESLYPLYLLGCSDFFRCFEL